MASTLRAGSIAIVGYNGGSTDGTGNPPTEDKISFVITAPITTGTIIYLTDRTWTPTAGSTALGAGTFANSGTDGTFAWTASRDHAAGEVVSLTQAQFHAAGFNFEHAGGETIYAYQGAINAPTHFLWALEAGDGNAVFGASLVNTGLTAGYTAGAIAGDAGAYVGPSTHAQTFLANGAGVTILHAIADSANWAIDDQDGQNALEQPVQTDNWFVHHDVDLYGAASGGGNGFVNLGADSTGGGFTLSHQISHLYNNLLNAGVSVFWHPNDIVIDTVRGKFFVADSDATDGHNRILQGNIADLLGNPGTIPTLTVLFSDSGITTDDQIDNLEIDSVNGIVYFSNGTALRKVSYDTANQAGTLLVELDQVANPAGSGFNFIQDMAFNPNTSELYMSSSRITVFSSTDNPTKNYIYKVVLTPGLGENGVTFGNNISLLPFSPDDGADTGGGVIAGEAFPKEEGLLEALAIDPLTNTLYFTTTQFRFDHDGNSGTAPVIVRGAVFSYDLNSAQNPAGSYTQIYESTDDGDTDSQTISHAFGPQGLLGDIEVDGVNGKWYVVDETGDQLGATNPPGDEGIWQGNLNGTGGVVYYGDVNNINGLVVTGFTINNAPTMTGSAAGGLAVTEASSAPNSGETSRVTLYTGITIGDLNTGPGDEITGAVIRIGEGFTYEAASTAGGHAGTVDFLRINGLTSGTIAGSGIAFTYNQTTGAMVLSGAATVAEYKAAIELVQFSTSGDNVTADGNAVTRKVYVSVSDGLTMSDEIVATVNVTGINDAPVNAVGSAMSFNEDTTGVIGQQTPSVIAPVNAITGLAFGDADADASSELFTVTLGVTKGTLTIRTDVTGGLTAAGVAGNGTGALTLTGTQNAINATLAATVTNAAGGAANGLVYTPSANYNGADTLTVITNDQGNNGNDPDTVGDNGVSEADTDFKTINIADVNDAPTVIDTTQDSPTILEDLPFTNATAPTVASLFGASFSDATDVQRIAVTNPNGSPGDTLAGIAIVANGSSAATGQWQYWNGSNWVNIGAASTAAAKTVTAATPIRFEPALNYNGAAPTLTAHLVETGGIGLANGGTMNLTFGPFIPGGQSTISTGTVVLGQAITAVNDRPVIAWLSGDNQNYYEGDAPRLIDMDGNNAITDVDSPNFNGGSLTASFISGNTVVAEDQLVIVTSASVTITAGVLSVDGAAIGTVSGGGAGAGDILVTFTSDNATPVRVQKLIAALGYVNSDTETPTIGTRGVNVTLNDGDGSDNGGVPSRMVTSILYVYGINDDPSGANKLVTIAEDVPYIFAGADFGFSDVDSGFAGVRITTLPAASNGILRLDGVAVVAGQIVAAANISKLTYTPVLDGNGVGQASFTFQVRDDGPGPGQDATPNTISFDVAAVNDVPAIANLNGDTVTYTEGDGTMLVDLGINAIVTDVDSVDFDGGALLFDFAAAGTGDRLILIEGGGVTLGAPDMMIGARAVIVDGVTIGSLAPGGSIVDVALNGNATAALVQKLVRAVTYTNTAGLNNNDDLLETGTRTVNYSLSDGDGSGASSGSVTINLVGVNDAPGGADKTVSTSEDDPYTFAWADFGFSDLEGDSGIGVRIDELPTAGVLQLDGVAVTDGQVIGKNDIDAGKLSFVPAADQSGDDYASFEFSVRDDGGTLNGGAEFDASAKVMTIDVTADNFAPAFDLSNIGPGATLAYTENGAAAALAPSAQISDADSPDFDGGTLTVSYQANGDGADQLSILQTGSGAGQLDLSGSDVRYEGVVIGTVAGGSNGTSLVVTFDTGATPAAVQSLVRAVGYSSSSNTPNGLPKTVNFTLTDGDGGSAQANATVNSSAVNDAPSIDLDGATAGIDAEATYTENAMPVGLTPDALVLDIDSADLDGGKLTVSGVLGAGEFLYVNGYDPVTNEVSIGGVVIGTLAFGTDSIEVTLNAGATPARLQTLLRGVYFEATGEDPAGGTREFTYTLTDGDGGTSTLASVALTVTPVNDVAAAEDDTASTDEATAKSIDVLANDVALDAPAKAVTHIAGTAVSPGGSVTLGSGAKVTLNMDGTLTYDPNGAFDSLTGAASGGANLSDTDTFSYTEADGDTATVTVTIAGLVSAGDDIVGGAGDNIFNVDNLDDMVIEALDSGTDEVRTALGSRTDFAALYVLPANVENLTGTSAGAQGVAGNALDNVIVMGAGGDLILLTDGGNDDVQGGGGNDFLYYGGAFTSADSNDGGAGVDTVALMGVYDVALAATSLVNVEKLALYSSGNAQAPNSYDIETDDANVAAGRSLMVIGMSLQANETLAFDGSAETDGRFNIRGGRGADDLTGGALGDQFFGNLGADLLSGGGGNDMFEYYAAAESTSASRDTIRAFAAGDRINLVAIDADGNAANGDTAFSHIGSAAFTGIAGQLRVTQGANEWLVEADIDGDTVADLVIGVNVVDGHMMTQSDFLI